MNGGAAPAVARREVATAAIADLLPVALVVVAEAAWISVIGGLLQEFAFREPILGIPELALFVVVGSIVARVLGRRLDERWPIVALAVVAAAAVVGWLTAPGARTALGEGIGPAIAAHPAGWLAGLAVLRGYANAELPLPESRVAHLLALGVPGLVLATVVGGLIAEPYRGRFLADAFSSSIVFIVATTLALALSRLTAIGRESGFDWRRNPAWLGLTLGLLAIVIVAALPLSTVAGRVIQTVVSAALVPLLIIGLATGFDRTARRIMVFLGAAAVGVYVLVTLFAANRAPPPPPPGIGGGQGQPAVADQVMTLSLGGLALLAAIIAVLVLAAVWMRRTRPPDEDLVEETRTIDRGVGGEEPRRRRRRFGRRPEPAGAAAAYVALVADLDRHPAVRRDAAETPAEHAARLRSTGRAELSLDLLAADYALARYGAVELPDREDRRAIGRWRALRRRLVRPQGPR
jgi:MFS family permease